MSPAQVVTGPPSAGSVLRPQLAGADFVHACQATTHRDGRSALQAYRDMAATIPGWFDGLMALRNRGMRLLGMKHLGSLRAVQDIAQPRPGQRLGIFTLQALDDDAIVLGDDDRQLRVQLARQWKGDVVGVAAVVHTHNAVGRADMLPVAPGHQLIVPDLLRVQVLAYR